MTSVPVYRPEGRFGTPLKSILNFITSLRLPVLLLPKIGVVERSNPAFAPPKGTVLESAKNAPPLFEIENADEGMLLPTPSVNADAALAVQQVDHAGNAGLVSLFRQGVRPLSRC